MADTAGHEETEALKYYFSQGYTRKEILNFLRAHHGISYSLATLKRRLQQCSLSRKSHSSLLDITQAIQRELAGSGSDLGYRSMWHTLRMKYSLQIECAFIIMFNL